MSKEKQSAATTSTDPVLLKYDPAKIGTLTTTAAKIRYLDSCGMKRGEIAKLLGVRYQWVRNVLITPIKKQQ